MSLAAKSGTTDPEVSALQADFDVIIDLLNCQDISK